MRYLEGEKQDEESMGVTGTGRVVAKIAPVSIGSLAEYTNKPLEDDETTEGAKAPKGPPGKHQMPKQVKYERSDPYLE